MGTNTRQLLWYPAPRRADAGGFIAPLADDVGALVKRYLRPTLRDVSAETLAILGATLANGGVNPRTGVRAAGRENVLYILSAMLTAGMYDASGNSVRGLRVIEDLARRWSLHVLISDQHNAVEKGDINGD